MSPCRLYFCLYIHGMHTVTSAARGRSTEMLHELHAVIMSGCPSSSSNQGSAISLPQQKLPCHVPFIVSRSRQLGDFRCRSSRHDDNHSVSDMISDDDDWLLRRRDCVAAAAAGLTSDYVASVC